MKDLSLVESRLRSLVSKRKFLFKTKKKLQARLSKVKELALDCEEAQKTAQLVSQALQQKAHERISGIVSKCLASVFPEPYTFQLVFESKRGKTDARLTFRDRKGREIDPLTASGGGAVDVASFALRCASLILSRPVRRRVVILDEPFKFVSAAHKDSVRAMLTELSKELNIQVIQVTHIPELKIGKIHQI